MLPNPCANCDFVAGVEAQLQAHRLAKHLRNDKDRQQAAKQAAAEKKRMDEMTAAKQKAEDNTADAAGKQRKCTRGKGKDPCSNPQCTSSSLATCSPVKAGRSATCAVSFLSLFTCS